MEYKYYVQKYAKNRAKSILPVPENYPLRGDFGPGFISDFSELTEILKKIYVDVSETPDAYECVLYPLNQEARGKGADNDSNLSLDRIVKCLRILCDCGEIQNNALCIKAADFNKQIKKVKNYSAVIEKLKYSGFVFQGNIFEKNTENFLVTYPDRGNIINVLKIYMDCWNDVLNDDYIKNEIKRNGYGCIAYYYGYYLFDYKVTANPRELSAAQLIKDESFTWDNESKEIFLSFYEHSKEYPEIRFSGGGYYIGKKRVCIFRYDNNEVFLKIKLKNPEKYINEIEKLPEHLLSCFSKNAKKCRNCGCLGKAPESCSNRIYWKINGVDYIGCSIESFYFNDVKSKDIPCLFKLLECEYGIKMNN